MKKRSNKFKALAGIVAGCMILTGAVFANIDNANGYSSYKNAVKNLIKLSNCTAEFNMTAYLDDTKLEEYKILSKIENNKFTSSSASESAVDSEDYKSGVLDDDATYLSQNYTDGEFEVHVNTDSGNGYKSIDITDISEYSEENGVYNPILGGNVDEKLLDKAIRFAEVAADSFIGDIKNNFVYLGEENGEKHYNITLSREQMPSIVTSGLSLFCGITESQYDYDSNDERGYDYNDANDIVEMMFINEKEPFVKSASCDFKVDSNGNLVNNILSGTIVGYTNDGEEHSIGLRIEINIMDIGTTAADRFDVYGLMGDINMLDGSTRSFKELISEYSRIVANVNGYDIYLSCYSADKINSEIYIVDNKEVSNSEYNKVKKASDTEIMLETDASVSIADGADETTEIIVTEN